MAEYAAQAAATLVWDIGGNVAVFSRIAATTGVTVVSIDSDPSTMDSSYRRMVDSDERKLFPIVADLKSPSSAMGRDNREVRSLTDRGPAGLLMARWCTTWTSVATRALNG